MPSYTFDARETNIFLRQVRELLDSQDINTFPQWYVNFASLVMIQKDEADTKKTVSGKVIKSRPEMLADIVERLETIKLDIQGLSQEYEEWGEKINEGATQDKINDTCGVLDEATSSVEEVVNELEGLAGELPLGFGRD
jgi:predicted  nucleic acid-binding Zn-ribbon protein